jgi:hypothetical protein
MNRQIPALAFLALCGLSLLLHCGNPTRISGNGSDVGNCALAGKVYTPDGTTPAAGAVVHIQKWQEISNPSIGGLPGSGVDVATAIADGSGAFAIKSLDSGMYILEANDDKNNLAFVDSIAVTNPQKRKDLPPCTLRPSGAIKGRIALSSGGDPRKVFVFTYQAIRFGVVDLTGSFLVSDLPEGSYTVRFLPALDNYDVLDTANIRVWASDTTDLGTIAPAFTGIPVPQNPAISYDTLKQIVTLSWTRSDTSLAKGYDIYRRDTDSGFGLLPLNGVMLVRDTVFRDTFVNQEHTYEYKIVAVDKGDNLGKMSAGVSARISSFLAFIAPVGAGDAGVGCFSNVTGLLGLRNGTVAVADQGMLRLYSAGGNHLKDLLIGGWLSGITEGDSGNIYVMRNSSGDSSSKIFLVDSSLQLQDSLLVGVFCSGVTMIKGSLYVPDAGTPGSFEKVSKDFSLPTVSRILLPGMQPYEVVSDSQERLYFMNATNQTITIVDTAGNNLGSWGKINTSSGPATPGYFQDGAGFHAMSICEGPRGLIFVADPFAMRIQAFTGSGEFVARVEPGKVPRPSTVAFTSPYFNFLTFDNLGNILVSNNLYIYKYSVNLH